MSEFSPGPCDDQHMMETGCCNPFFMNSESPGSVDHFSSEGAGGTQHPLTPLTKVYWSGTIIGSR